MIEPITTYLLNKGFQITESTDNYIAFRSDKIGFIFSRDPREKAYGISVTKEDEYFEINEQLLLDLFKYKASFIHVDNDNYIFDLVPFFESNGNGLLNGDKTIVEAIKAYSIQEAEAYTSSLLERQILSSADKTWETQNYADFIRILDSIDEPLTASYKLKRKIALHKLNNLNNPGNQ